MPRFVNLTRGNEIGANCYYAESGGSGVVLDSGMHPKAEGAEALPAFEKLKGRPVRAVFLTHAHHDHAGTLPLLLPHLPEDARVFMSEPTYFLAEPLLHNSVNVMKRQREERRMTEYPLFTHQEVDRGRDRWQACHLERPWSLAGHPLGRGETDPATFTLHHAGHILGSVAVRLDLHGERLLYTGDINFADQTILGRATLPESGIDTLVIETTRGAHPTPAGQTRRTESDRLLQDILAIFEQGGAVLMPIFAMGKTQEVLALLHRARQRGALDWEGLWIGGLGKVFTQLYDRLVDVSAGRIDGISLLEEAAPEVLDLRGRRPFKPHPRHLYLVPSGMMTEMTTSNRIAEEFLRRPEHAVFFVGYTDPASPAGRLRAAAADAAGRPVDLNADSLDQSIRCPVRHYDLTSHALREDLLDYIGKLKPRRCFLVHGDVGALSSMQEDIRRLHPAIETIIPESGREYTWD